MGPYSRTDAEQVLQVFSDQGSVPLDAYLSSVDSYGNQFWPVGANVLNQGTIQLAQATGTDQAEPAAAPEPQPADETPAEAGYMAVGEDDQDDSKRAQALDIRAVAQAVGMVWRGLVSALAQWRGKSLSFLVVGPRWDSGRSGNRRPKAQGRFLVYVAAYHGPLACQFEGPVNSAIGDSSVRRRRKAWWALRY